MNHTPKQFPFERDLRIGQTEPYFPFENAPYKQLQICAGDRVIANVLAVRGGDDQCQAETEYIKTACNSHEKLVNSLRELVNRFEIEGFVPNARFKCICNENLDNGDCRHLRARKALAAAEVKS